MDMRNQKGIQRQGKAKGNRKCCKIIRGNDHIEGERWRKGNIQNNGGGRNTQGRRF